MSRSLSPIVSSHSSGLMTMKITSNRRYHEMDAFLGKMGDLFFDKFYGVESLEWWASQEYADGRSLGQPIGWNFFGSRGPGPGICLCQHEVFQIKRSHRLSAGSRLIQEIKLCQKCGLIQSPGSAIDRSPANIKPHGRDLSLLAPQLCSLRSSLYSIHFLLATLISYSHISKASQ